MNFVLITLFVIYCLLLCYGGITYHNGSRKLSVSANAPAEDRQYWATMTVKHKKSFFVGAAGGLLAAIAIAIKNALAAEIGCITLLAALVYALGILCRKVAFRPNDETEKLQKRWKLILLANAFIVLLITQQVFRYFLSI